jgi:hypothetical protein
MLAGDLSFRPQCGVRTSYTEGAPLHSTALRAGLRFLQGRVRCCRPHEILILSRTVPKRNLSPTYIDLYETSFVQKIVSIAAPRL